MKTPFLLLSGLIFLGGMNPAPSTANSAQTAPKNPPAGKTLAVAPAGDDMANRGFYYVHTGHLAKAQQVAHKIRRRGYGQTALWIEQGIKDKMAEKATGRKTPKPPANVMGEVKAHQMRDRGLDYGMSVQFDKARKTASILRAQGYTRYADEVEESIQLRKRMYELRVEQMKREQESLYPPSPYAE